MGECGGGVWWFKTSLLKENCLWGRCKKKVKKTNKSAFSATHTYIKLTLVSFFYFFFAPSPKQFLKPTHVLHVHAILVLLTSYRAPHCVGYFFFNSSMECKLYSRLQYKSHVRIGFDLSIGNMNQEWEPEFFAI